MWKKAAITYMKVPTQRTLRGTEGNYKNSQSYTASSSLKIPIKYCPNACQALPAYSQ
jgi:hypothetical protein